MAYMFHIYQSYNTDLQSSVSQEVSMELDVNNHPAKSCWDIVGRICFDEALFLS